MGEAAAIHRLTLAEYVAREAESDVRHEFVHGEVYAMAGGSPRHAAITMNVGGALIARLRREFNVSVAEVDLLDSHRSAILGIACVSNDKAYAHGLLMKVVERVERWRIDADLVDYEIELIE